MKQPSAPFIPYVSNLALRRGLAAAMAARARSGDRIERIERRPSPYASSFNLEELTVELDSGAVLNLMFKDLSRRAMNRRARLARPEFLYGPRREVWMYENVLGELNLGTARFYGALSQARSGRYWLFIERAQAIRVYQASRFAAWTAAARWIAQFHRRSSPHGANPKVARRLIRYDRDYYRCWIARAQQFVRRGRPGHGAARIDWLADRYDRLIDRLTALPVTVIHGEFYPVNILVEDVARRARVCPVDWEMAAVGPGLIDLAALTAGNWPSWSRRAMEKAYRDTAGARRLLGRLPFNEALDCCRLHLAVQWLGWSDRWKPAPQRSQDWLSLAVTLAEKLRL